MRRAGAPDPPARLLVLAGPAAGTLYELVAGSHSLGRHPSNDFEVADLAMSRRHCRFEKDASGWRVVDLESSYGTFVNGVAVASQRLYADDEIALGSSVFRYLEGEGTPRPLHTRSLQARSTLQLAEEESWHDEPSAVLSSADQDREVLRALLDAGPALASATRLEKLAPLALHLALRVVPAASAHLIEAGRELRSLAAVGGERRGWALEAAAARSLVLQVIASRCAAISEAGFGRGGRRRRSLLCVPLASPQRPPPGVILLSSEAPEAFGKQELRSLTAFAGIAGPALSRLQQADRLDEERRRLRENQLARHMVGESAEMRNVARMLLKIAPSDSTVLVLGETGTGKELAARSLHRESRRAEGPFVAINCPTLTESLAESELFGHEKGAFTGADRRKLGRLEHADGGTIFLDEIGDLSASSQARLLRVLQERTLERVGGHSPVAIDVRVIAATNRDLEGAVAEGSFREDLYYRLSVIQLRLPPLRERGGDVRVLAEHFRGLHAAALHRRVTGFSERAIAALERHSWPGNVRELSNAIERAVVLAEQETIDFADLPPLGSASAAGSAAEPTDLQGAVEATRRRVVAAALRATGGNVTQAAERLGLHPNYLHRLLNRLGLR